MKKDLEWLRRKVLDNKFTGHTIHIDVVFELMDELDEPEVLSWEWIEENSALGQFATSEVINFDKFVKADKLKNLLVPERELPVIPRYIADWIEDYNWKLENWKLPSTFRSDVKYKADQRQYEWANKKGNMDIFMKAILLGYEVEERELTVKEVIEEHIELLKKQEVAVNLKPYYDLWEELKDE